LDDHPQICCHGELFGPDAVRGISKYGHLQFGTTPSERRSGSIDFLNNAYKAKKAKVKAVGFKLLYQQAWNIESAELLDHLASDHNIRFLFLWRRNLVARFLSERKRRMRLRGEESPRLPGVGEVQQDSRNQIAALARTESHFRKHPRMYIDYEDLVADGNAVFKQVWDFLSVREFDISLPVDPEPSQSSHTRQELDALIGSNPSLLSLTNVHHIPLVN